METLIASLELYIPVYFLTKLYFSCNLIKVCRIIAGVVQGLSTSLQVCRTENGCIRLRTNTSLIRMISRSAYGFSIFVITCLHTSDERVQTLYTSCIRIVSNGAAFVTYEKLPTCRVQTSID